MKNKEIQFNLKNSTLKNFSSYEELALNSSLSKNTISNLLNSDNFNPTLATLKKLSYACGQDCIKLCYINGSFRNSIVRKIAKCILIGEIENAKNKLKDLEIQIKESNTPKNYHIYIFLKKNYKLFNFYFMQTEKKHFNYNEFKNDFTRCFNYSITNFTISDADYFKRDIFYCAGLILSRNLEFKDAIAIFNELANFDFVDDNYLLSNISLAKCLYYIQDYERAMKTCNKAIKICIDHSFCFDILEALRVRDMILEKLIENRLKEDMHYWTENII
ncbi:MAG: hypothetical protein Q4E02_00110 [Lagierella massiliensis]|nr:hypothetical protein [Lagierella massiliensis]